MQNIIYMSEGYKADKLKKIIWLLRTLDFFLIFFKVSLMNEKREFVKLGSRGNVCFSVGLKFFYDGGFHSNFN